MSAFGLRATVVMDPLVDVKQETDSVELISKGPVVKNPIVYQADNASSTNILFQNITPASTDTVLAREISITYEIYVAFYLLSGPDTNGTTAAATLWNWDPTTRGDRFMNTLAASAALSGGLVPYGNPANNRAWQLRSLPFNNIIRNADMKINANGIPYACGEVASIWSHTADPRTHSEWATSFPFYSDSGPVQASATTALSGAGTYMRYPAEPMPLLPAPDQSAEITLVGCKRGAASTANSIGATLVYRIKITEPLIVPPLLFGNTFNNAGLSRIANLTINATLANLTNMIKLDSGITVGVNGTDGALTTDPVVTFGQGGATFTYPGVSGPTINAPAAITLAGLPRPTLNIMYALPDPITLRAQPQFAMYPFEQLQLYTTPVTIDGTATPGSVGATWSARCPAIRLATIPSTFYIFAQPSLTAMGRTGTRSASDATPNGYQLSNTFLNITSLNLQVLERVGQFTTYTPLDIYRMSAANGYKGTYWDWLYRTGSLVIMDTNSDICLSAREADGQNIVTTFQIAVTGNYSAAQYQLGGTASMLQGVEYLLYVVAVIPGKIVIGGGLSQVVCEGPNPAQVYSLLSDNAPKAWPADITSSRGATTAPSGGGLFSTIGRVAKTARAGVAGLHHLVSAHGDTFKKVLGTANRLLNPDDEGGDIVAGSFKRSR